MRRNIRYDEWNASRVICFVLMVAAALFVFVSCSTKKVSKTEVQPASSMTEKSQQSQTQAIIYQQFIKRLQPEIKTNKAEVKQFDNQVRITIQNDILFPGGGLTIDRKGVEILDKIILVLKELKNQAIEVNGHTDNSPVGPSLRSKFSTSRELSLARAVEIVSYFQKKGIDRDMMSATGYGAEQSVATNDTPQGRAKNRRTEIIVVAQVN